MLLSSKTLFTTLLVTLIGKFGVCASEYVQESKQVSYLEVEKPIGPHIKIYFDGYEAQPEYTKKITQAVSFLHFFYTKQLGVKLPKNLKIKLRVFGDYYSYKIYQMGFSRSTTDGAFYSSKFDEAVVWRRKDEVRLLKDICHEVSHLIVGNIINDKGKFFKKRPLWINEGLAEYFENIKIINGEIVVEPDFIKLKRCRKWLLNDELIYLSKFLNFNNIDWKRFEAKEGQYQSRTISWCLVYFMFSKPEGSVIISNILNAIADNQLNRQNSIEAVTNFYPGGVEALENDWKSWLIQEERSIAQKLENNSKLLPNYFPNIKSEELSDQEE